MAKAIVDTSLNSRGLRNRCPEGHPLYWHIVDGLLNYSRHGCSGGICTAGDVWDQDAAYNAAAKPGRLRSAGHGSPLLGGVGFITLRWDLDVNRDMLVPDVHVMCRAGHRFGEARPHDEPRAWKLQLPQPDANATPNSYLARLTVLLINGGWTTERRIECAEHRAEREAVTARLAELAAADGSENAPAVSSGPPRAAPPADVSAPAPPGAGEGESAVLGGVP